MTTGGTGVEVRPLAADEWDRAAALLHQAFHFAPPLLDRLRANPAGELWVADVGGRVDAVLRVERCGQFFGGRAVPCATVGGVAVASEARGRGLADVLMRGVLAALRADGVSLSSLIPSVMGPYRRVGYEVAGVRIGRSADLPSLRLPAGGALEPWGDDDLAGVKEAYRAFARTQAGPLDRPDGWWEHRTLAARDGGDVNRFLFRRHGEVRGYLVYTEGPPAVAGPAGHPVDPFRYSVNCRDLVWLDVEAGEAILSFLGGHRMLADRVRWSGPVEEPLALLLSEIGIATDWTVPWMTRLVDVEAALCGRGYSPLVSGRIEFELQDPLCDRPRRVSFELADGTPWAEAAGADAGPPTVSTTVGTLAAVFTGWLRASEAARLGLLRCASDRETALLDAAFAGPAPWLGEQI